jgi:hypothetical protein
LLLTMTAAAGVAFAADVPHRRAGLWEIVTGASSTAAPRMSQRVCLDRETDELLDQAGIGVSQQMCSKRAGLCPNDMRPGDMIMTSGGGHPHEMRTNLHDVLKPPS